MKEWNPRVVVITGASGGLGQALAETFASHGLNIVVHFFSQKKRAEDIVKQIRHGGGTALAIKADIKNRTECVDMYEKIIQTWGQLDILINNAAITKDQSIRKMKEEDWESVIKTNLTGTFNALQSSIPFLLKQASGHIINIASYVGVHGREGQANYGASKSGVIALTKTAALELAGGNIRVNTVIPGLLQVGMGKKLSNGQRQKLLEAFLLPTVPSLRQVTEFIYSLSMMEGISGQVFNLDSRIL